MTRYLCIHGHFYQPPRENPWLETVEIQDSAQPYHDWSARITAECYAPNGAARIMGSDGLISHIVNNYEHISFNIGPTLAGWIERHCPEVWQLIQLGDAASVHTHNGHGNAIAQVYNDMIMPLASERDKRTQVLWGIRDFEYRFGRRPEGMWLAETAADRASLRALADQGIKFTILAPNQCARVRPRGQSKWTELPIGAVDPRQPYRVDLGDGQHIDVFFYDGMISKTVAFESLLTDGERYARRLLDGFVPSDDETQLVHTLQDVLERYDSSYRNLFDQSIRTIQLLVEIGTPPPVELLAAASCVVRVDLERALAHSQNGNLTAAMTALRRARKWGIPLDRVRLEMGLRQSLETQARSLLTDLEEETLQRTDALLNLADAIPVELVLWETQNIFNDALHLHAARQRLDPKILQRLGDLARRVKLNPAPILEASRPPVAA